MHEHTRLKKYIIIFQITKTYLASSRNATANTNRISESFLDASLISTAEVVMIGDDINQSFSSVRCEPFYTLQ